MKVVENSLQNARNRTILNFFLEEHAPKPPEQRLAFSLCGMYIQNHRNFKVGPPPPLRNPAYAPGFTILL